MRLLRRGFVVGRQDEDRLLQANGGIVTIGQTFQIEAKAVPAIGAEVLQFNARTS
jgi:hypothetical protein